MRKIRIVQFLLTNKDFVNTCKFGKNPEKPLIFESYKSKYSLKSFLWVNLY